MRAAISGSGQSESRSHQGDVASNAQVGEQTCALHCITDAATEATQLSIGDRRAPNTRT